MSGFGAGSSGGGGGSGDASAANQLTQITLATTTNTLLNGGLPAALGAGGGLKIDGSGTALPISGTITANIGTTNGLALDATLAKLTISQSAALGSNTQVLIGGSVSTSAPSYTNGNINPLSLTTAGAIRVDGSGATQPVSGTITANIGTTNGLALDATLTTLSGKFASAATLADAASNPTVTSLGNFNHVFNGSTWDRARSGLLTAQSAATGIQNTLNMGRYNSSAPTLTDGQVIALQLDVSGNTKVTEQFAPQYEDNTNAVAAMQVKPLAATTYAYSLGSNLGANATQNVKSSTGNVFSVMCQNLNVSIRYFQLHNTATTPAGGATPILSFPVPGSSTVIIGTDFFGAGGLNFTTGVAMAFSTTSSTYTAGTNTDQMSFVAYK